VIGQVHLKSDGQLDISLPSDLKLINGVITSDLQLTLGRRMATQVADTTPTQEAAASEEVDPFSTSEAPAPTVIGRITLATPPPIEPLPKPIKEPTAHFSGETTVITRIEKAQTPTTSGPINRRSLLRRRR